ncbi:MAG: glutamate--tRNA ligase [Alphaproteobacteria bacterium]|nr:glutamate--tRNA ligase [Alphaproteobacteria bacterium]TAD88037.1 MAG: glutamate--tRNA ligase [Alphaproteobacteria bacterium]
MSVRVRFAPSPTGLLHVGNARGALVNWLFARAQGGHFLLRIDDTDAQRSTPAFAAAIDADLQWLGLDWDQRLCQSARRARYDEALAALQAAGRVYACYETAEELEIARKLRLAQGRPPVYNRAGLSLSAAQRQALEAEGRRAHWRLKLSDEPVVWTDGIQGPKRFPPGSLSDPVLVKADGEPLYTFASVVDDLDTGITDVIRGEDHVANTAVQIELCRALGGEPPRYAHFPLLVDAAGAGLSKRLGSLSLQSLREDGIEPGAVAALLASLGTAQDLRLVGAARELVAGFDLGAIGRAPPRFDPAQLAEISARTLHQLGFEAVRDRLPVGADEAFWLAVRGNIAKVSDCAQWWQIICDGPAPLAERDQEFLSTAAALLPAAPFDASTWGQWTAAVKTATGKGGKALFLPLRRALTGRDHGPDLAALLPLIGRERTLARL